MGCIAIGGLASARAGSAFPDVVAVQCCCAGKVVRTLWLRGLVSCGGCAVASHVAVPPAWGLGFVLLGS